MGYKAWDVYKPRKVDFEVGQPNDARQVRSLPIFVHATCFRPKKGQKEGYVSNLVRRRTLDTVYRLLPDCSLKRGRAHAVAQGAKYTLGHCNLLLNVWISSTAIAGYGTALPTFFSFCDTLIFRLFHDTRLSFNTFLALKWIPGMASSWFTRRRLGLIGG